MVLRKELCGQELDISYLETNPSPVKLVLVLKKVNYQHTY